MSIRFRRRLRLAPGVYINFSKSGLSATIGKRGASLTLNSQGLYGNVGIPGTGLSYRTRLLKPQKNVDQEIGYPTKQINNPTPNAITYFKQLPSVYPKNDVLPIKRNKGTGMIILGVLLLVVTILLWLSGMRDPIVFGIITGCVLFSILFLWIGIDSARSYNDMDTTNINNLKKVNQVLEKNKFTSPLQVEILEETKKYLEIASQIDAINAALIKLQKRQTKRNREKLFQLNEQLEPLQNSLQECGIIADGNLTKPQLDAYQQFCYKMRKVKEYDGIWKYLSDKSYSIARMTEDTFSVLKYIEKVPTIVTSTEAIYFYPKYIIKALSNYNFDILEWNKANCILTQMQLPIPQSEIDKFTDVQTTFLYETKDGLPDKRYKYNPLLALANVGLWTITNIETKYYFNDVKQAMHINSSIKQYIKTLNNQTMKTSKISNDYSANLEVACSKLINFYSTLQKNTDFRSFLQANMQCRNNSVQDITNQVHRMFEYDILKCYITIKGNIDFNSQEGLSLLYILLRLYKPETNLSLEFINENLELPEVKSYMIKLEKLAYGIVDETQGKSYLFSYPILKLYDKDLCYQFLILLYRVLSLIVKADGVINEVEAQLLSKIVNMQMEIKEVPDNMNVPHSENYDENDLLHEPMLADIAKFIVDNQDATLGKIQQNFNMGFEKILDIRNFLSNNGIHSWTSREELHEKLISLGLEDHFVSKQEKQEASTPTIPAPHKTTSSTSNLDELIGLASVKKEVKTLTNFIKIQQQRVAQGMKVPSVSYHCVFTGNPGTGKTTVARIIADIYHELGILEKGHLVETDRAGLVAEYVRLTAVKTNKIIDSALDGVLFIDEAYSLSEGGANDFGKEAIATLLKRMEDNRDRLVVILAGYTNEMQGFIDINPGLQSRFNRYIDFPDYSADELLQIFESNLKKFDYKMTDEAIESLATFFTNAVAHKDKNFGNARFARNIFEKTLERQANRLATQDNITNEALTLIEKEDLPLQ